MSTSGAQGIGGNGTGAGTRNGDEPTRCPRCRGRMVREQVVISYRGETHDLVCIACGYRVIFQPPTVRRARRAAKPRPG